MFATDDDVLEQLTLLKEEPQAFEEKAKSAGGDWRAAAACYEDFQRLYPKSSRSADALFNAAIAWEKGGEEG